MKINNINQPYDPVYDEDGFIIMVQSHLTFFKNSGYFTIITPTPHQSIVYIGDFYGLLNDLNIAKQYHRIILMCNYMTSSIDYDSTIKNIRIPLLQQIDLLKNIYESTLV